MQCELARFKVGHGTLSLIGLKFGIMWCAVCNVVRVVCGGFG